MNLASLEVPEDEAREKLAEYEQALGAHRTAEDAAIAAGYRAAARGFAVISLPRTVAAGGFHDNSLPRIAVIRADATECYARWAGDALIFTDEDWRATTCPRGTGGRGAVRWCRSSRRRTG